MALPDPPLKAAVVMVEDQLQADKLPKLIMTPQWFKYLGLHSTAIDATAQRVSRDHLAGQHASILLTPLDTGLLPAGRYRVSCWFKVTTVGTISSSLQLSLFWTRGGTTLTFAGAAEAGNLLSTYQGFSREVYIDDDTPISFSTTYASAGAQEMRYELDILVESLAVDAT